MIFVGFIKLDGTHRPVKLFLFKGFVIVATTDKNTLEIIAKNAYFI